jgi:hypothetical protein
MRWRTLAASEVGACLQAMISKTLGALNRLQAGSYASHQANPHQHV